MEGLEHLLRVTWLPNGSAGTPRGELLSLSGQTVSTLRRICKWADKVG